MTAIPQTNAPVVLHLHDGFTQQTLARPRIDEARKTVTVDLPDHPAAEIAFADLKAIFFLRDFPAAMDEPGNENSYGTVLTIEFRDGERIRALADDYSPERPGFFVYPLDRSKNEKIFVVNTAILSIDIEKF